MNKKTKNIVLLLIILSIILFAFILNILGVFSAIETKFLDLRLSMNNTGKINDNIVRLYLDDLSKYDFKKYKDLQDYRKHLPRTALSRLITYLEEGSPKLILLNFDLSNYEDPALSSISPDIILSKTLSKYKNIILASTLKKDAGVEDEFADIQFKPTKSSLKVTVNNDNIDKKITYYSHSPIPDIFVDNTTVAVPNIISEQGVVRYSKPIYKIEEKGKNYYIPSTAFAAFLKYNNLENAEITINKHKLFVNDYEFNMNNKGEIFLNLKAKEQYYTAFPLGAVLAGIYDTSDKFKIDGKIYHKSFFKNKIIIIEELPENISIKSLANGEKLTEGEITAAILDSYLTDSNTNDKNRTKYPITASIFTDLMLTFLFCYLIAFINLKYGKKILSILPLFGFVLLAMILYAIPALKLIIAITIPLYFMIFSYLITAIIASQAKQAQRNVIINIFEKHVSKSVLAKILKNYKEISLKPEKKYITAMYCNINDFTALTNTIESDLLFERLNEFLDVIIQVSLKNDGTVNKLNNNSVIAYWGAPLPSDSGEEGDAKNAIKSAIEILNITSLINEQRTKEDEFLLDLKIAVHSGEALVGNIGTQNLSSYTAFGDTIDTIYKIEKICHQFKKNVLVSGSAYNLLKACKNPQLSDKTIEFGYAGAISNKSTPGNKLALYEVNEFTAAQDDEND